MWQRFTGALIYRYRNGAVGAGAATKQLGECTTPLKKGVPIWFEPTDPHGRSIPVADAWSITSDSDSNGSGTADDPPLEDKPAREVQLLPFSMMEAVPSGNESNGSGGQNA